MSGWNKEAAPNNNLSPKTISSSKLIGQRGKRTFSEELSDSGERDQLIEMSAMKNKK